MFTSHIKTQRISRIEIMLRIEDPQIARFMGPAWDPSGSHVGPTNMVYSVESGRLPALMRCITIGYTRWENWMMAYFIYGQSQSKGNWRHFMRTFHPSHSQSIVSIVTALFCGWVGNWSHTSMITWDAMFMCLCDILCTLAIISQ